MTVLSRLTKKNFSFAKSKAEIIFIVLLLMKMNTKVPNNDEEITQYLYLLRADKDSPWHIWEQRYDAVN